MKINNGDKIKIKLKSDSIEEGLFVNSNDSEFITLKLESGYNKKIKKSNIDSFKVIKQHEPKKIVKQEIKQNPELPIILLLQIGGTIACKVNYETGGVSAQSEPEDLIEFIPEISSMAQIITKRVSNVFSGNMRFEHYNMIAKEIIENLDQKIDGIIISHGTDTLHYTSSALSFILQNIKIPIVLIGSQRSSDRPSSDSKLNLISAINFIISQKKEKTDLTGFFAVMHANSSDDYCNVYSGLNLRKMHSTKRNCFKQINSLPLARINLSGKIEYNKIVFERIKNKENVEPLFEPAFFNSKIKIGILKAHPNLFEEEINFYKSFDGLIIEGTGLGHLSVESIDVHDSENEKIFKSLMNLSNKIPVVMSTQCIFGITNLNIYSYGRKIKNLGIMDSGLLSSETAFIKLAWLLSNFDFDEVKDLWNRNFVGELIYKNIFDEFDEK
jgi:glutamyl-tRNA(Gln) amidotransferase subunit D